MTAYCRTTRTYTLMDVVIAAKAQTFRGKCEASALLAIIGKQDVSKLAHELKRHAVEAGLMEWIEQNEIERIITEALATARKELDEAAIRTERRAYAAEGKASGATRAGYFLGLPGGLTGSATSRTRALCSIAYSTASRAHFAGAMPFLRASFSM